MNDSCEKTMPNAGYPAFHKGNIAVKINGVTLMSKMGKKTGRCRRDKCSNPISENPEANQMRICDDHFKTYNAYKERRKARNIEAIVGSTIPLKTLIAMERKYRSRNKQAPKTKDQLSRMWFSSSRVRKSNVKHILTLREWKNTQSLLRNKKLSLYKNTSLFDYVRDICLLYQRKFYISRDFLNPDNKYKKHATPLVSRTTPYVTLKLEVAFSFQTGRDITANDEDMISTSSIDIIIVPQKIRRMVVLKKAMLRKKYMNGSLFSRRTDKGKKHKKTKKNKISGNQGIYTHLKKQNIPDLESKMNILYELLNPRIPPYQYKAFQRVDITEELPLFKLCQSEYVRMYPSSRVNFFFDIKDLFRLNPILNELFALVAFYFLMSGESSVVVERFWKWRRCLLKWRPSIHKKALTLLQIFSFKIFKINISNKSDIVLFYNKFFSHDVLFLCHESDEIRSIINDEINV